MESFDASLKFLLQDGPEDFLRFGFGDGNFTIIEPSETGLPSRGRDIDGSYSVMRNGKKVLAHVEFHRRHQSLEELAIDVAEAQIRLFRRERCPVVSHVWDLYGDQTGPRMRTRKLEVGPGTISTYTRINLRAMKWQQILTEAPPGLWPLVPLAKNGATEIAVKAAREAISSREETKSFHLADHLAVLWFVAEAENVPTEVMKAYIKRVELMGSTLYQSIFAEGEEQGLSQGLAQGAVQAYADTISRLLARWLGSVDTTVREHLASFPSRDVVAAWHAEAFDLQDAQEARKLLDKILQTPIPPQAQDASRAA